MKIKYLLKVIYDKKFNIFENYAIKFIGFLMFTLYVYFRFLRARLPKDIPFNLSVIGFIILVEVCLLYAYIVWVQIRKPKKSNDIVQTIIEGFFQPLEEFDNYFKNLSFIKKYYPKIFLWISQRCAYMFKTLVFETCFFIIPRIILISILLVDIFYFHKLHYIYYVLVPFGLLLFIRRYFIYSIKKHKINLITEFKLYIRKIWTNYEYGIHPSEWPENFDPDDDDDDDDIPPTMSLDVNIFIDYHCKKVMREKESPEVLSFVNTKLFFDIFGVENENKYQIYVEQNQTYKKSLKKILDIALLFSYIEHNNSENKLLKMFKIIVYSLYFICWSFILLKSAHTLNIEEFIIFMNSTWEKIQDPFTGCKF